MGKKSRYEFEDLVYVGKKLYFATPGKVYQIITENIESLIDGGTGYSVKHFNGDDNRIRILSDYRDGNELKFMSLSEVRDLKINKILK
jgi:hypothetical protein